MDGVDYTNALSVIGTLRASAPSSLSG